MRCVNCQQEINVGGYVCPFCHYHPNLIGVGPYDGGPNSIPIRSGPSLMGLLRSLFSGKDRTGYTVFQDDLGDGNWMIKWRCNNCDGICFPNLPRCPGCGNPFKK